MIKKLLAIAILGCAVLVVPTVANAATGGISGEVTEFTSGNPVPEARVCAESQSGEFACVFAASNGIYSIGGLAPGSYAVEFSRGRSGRSLLPQYYDDREVGEQPVAVTVGSGVVTGIDGHLKPGGGIGGRVTESAAGAPVEEVEVCAFQVGEVEEFAGCTETNANGEYTILGLGEGNYEVVFFANYLGYEIQIYDGVHSSFDETLVPVSIGPPVGGIDAVLVLGGEISGHVYAAANGQPLAGIPVCLYRLGPSGLGPTEPFYCVETDRQAGYSFLALSEGSYKVGFNIEFGEFAPVAPVEPNGWPTIYWNQQPTLATADVITLARSAKASGIDARLGPPAVTPSPIVPPVVPITPPTTKPKPKVHCRKGTKARKRAGKTVCVKVHHKKRHHRRHRRHHGRHLHAA